MGKYVVAAICSLLVTSVASPALAQSQQTQQQPGAKPAHDPNEVVCERQEETGSRLASHRVCQTRAQWAEQRRTDRQDIDHAQMNVGTSQPGN